MCRWKCTNNGRFLPLLSFLSSSWRFLPLPSPSFPRSLRGQLFYSAAAGGGRRSLHLMMSEKWKDERAAGGIKLSRRRPLSSLSLRIWKRSHTTFGGIATKGGRRGDGPKRVMIGKLERGKRRGGRRMRENPGIGGKECLLRMAMWYNKSLFSFFLPLLSPSLSPPSLPDKTAALCCLVQLFARWLLSRFIKIVIKGAALYTVSKHTTRESGFLFFGSHMWEGERNGGGGLWHSSLSILFSPLLLPDWQFRSCVMAPISL